MPDWEAFSRLLSSPETPAQQTSNLYFTFETLVLQLLAAIAKAQGKSFEAHKRIDNTTLDAWLADGLDDIDGPAAVEIKLNVPFSPRFFETLARLSLLTRRLKGRSLLLIVGGHLKEHDRERITQWMAQNAPEILFRIWDKQILDQRLAEQSEAMKAVLPKLPSIAVENLVNRSVRSTPDQWKRDRRLHVQNARKAYDAGDLVLVLGAGVSATAGIPDWNTMLSRLLVSMIESNLPARLNSTEDERTAIARRLREVQDNSPLLEARYIRAGLRDSFESTVSKALYLDLDRSKVKRSTLLNSLAKLCLPKRSSAGLRSVVTYNFDDLLESQLRERGIPYRAIYHDGDFADKEELGIYHVHGFLPEDLSNYDPIDSSCLVLSEERYHSLMVEPYSWANLIQLTAFRENTCLFVGLSLTDPNLRRLLEIASKSNRSSRHYAVLRRLKPESLSPKRKSKVRKEVLQAFTYAHHDLQQASLKELGINIIWVEDYKEVPEIVAELTSAERRPAPARKQ